MSLHRVLDRPRMKEDIESDSSDKENKSGIGNQVNIPTCQIRVRPGGIDGSRRQNAGMGGTD